MGKRINHRNVVTMFIFMIKRTIQSEKWVNYVIPFLSLFVCFFDTQNLGQLDDAKGRKKKGGGGGGGLRITDNSSNTNQPLEMKNYTKYLGLLIDTNLS